MLTPYQNLRDRVGMLEHGFAKKYGARAGFRMQHYIRVNGVNAGGAREHIGWFMWDSTKRSLRKLLAEIRMAYPFHEDLRYHACVARNDARRDQAFEEDVTSLVDAIDVGH